jgi:hypothetical protein
MKGPDNVSLPGLSIDAFSNTPGHDADQEIHPLLLLLHTIEHPEEDGQFRAQLSRSARKALRQSRPAAVLASINGPAQELYFMTPGDKTDLSYTSLPSQTSSQKPRRHPKAAREPSKPLQLPQQVSLYSILARYLSHHTLPPSDELTFQYTPMELSLLRRQGYSPQSVTRWASSLVDPRPNTAAGIFEPSVETPPLFLLLLFLRRKHLRVFALGVIMRHLDRRIKAEAITWDSLKIIAVRLLRHARHLWPESLPWIANFFTNEARRLHDTDGLSPLSGRVLSDVTQFCNNFLLLLSLPPTIRPMVAAALQEKAQFHILQYMAGSSPPIVVTDIGFRSVIRNQLAHPKTPQEREWAQLKGPSWPPWKENRTAMDEDKGYAFGASRASNILHSMREAGYGDRIWDQIAQIYAGWDTDLSPTIQTRTTLPLFSSQFKGVKKLRVLLWAARIRTTRTRREAWACFLSYELSGEAAHPDIYRAMFEKIYYPEVQSKNPPGFSTDAVPSFEEAATDLLPGDMKEVLPDPQSSLQHVYLSEPVPGYKQLLHRMFSAGIKPSNRLLAFLLESCPEFEMGLHVLTVAQNKYAGKIGRILSGIHINDNNTSSQQIPGYLITAIIHFLCQFGRSERPLRTTPAFIAPEEHVCQFRLDRHYLLEYAHALLIHYRPNHRPAWTIFVSKLVQAKGNEPAGHTVRYRIVCELLEFMERFNLDIDDDMFSLICTATTYAVEAVDQRAASIEDARFLLSTGSHRLRTLFHHLVGANADMQSPVRNQDLGNIVPPHIPGPADLHAYVRALGSLHDYEGLYSFTTWLAKHRTEVTARAKAQHSGQRLLFRTLVALRIAVEGAKVESATHEASDAPDDIALLIKTQVEDLEEWGGWPAQEYVDMYLKGRLRRVPPSVEGR